MKDVDVVIAGGGIAGLSLAAALGSLGLTIAVLEPGRAGRDLRSTAYLLPARALFDELSLWDALAPHATPLTALRVIDTTGWPPEISEARTFDPADLDAEVFGWNIPNEVARDVLRQSIAAMDRVTLFQGVGFDTMLARTGEVRVTLSDGARLRARLLVGADGRDSAVRAAAGISAETQRYGQKALAFHARHSLPHDLVSTEIYNSGGAFTTVPLPDTEGKPTSAIVWMNDGARAAELTQLDDDAFNAEMTARACGVLGQMERATELNIWPVITRRAHALTSERTVLIAEAAHVLPPIGAQGLNTSLSDVRALFDLVKASPESLGDAEMLASYAKARETDTLLRAGVIDLFNRVCMSGAPAIQALRSKGLRALHGAAPVRRAVMRAGMGQV